MPSRQLVYAISLMWQHVSPSKARRQDGGIIYIRGNVYNFYYVKSEISVLQTCWVSSEPLKQAVHITVRHQYLQPAFQNEEKQTRTTNPT